jgi:hypothetical protein
MIKEKIINKYKRYADNIEEYLQCPRHGNVS